MMLFRIGAVWSTLMDIHGTIYARVIAKKHHHYDHWPTGWFHGITKTKSSIGGVEIALAFVRMYTIGYV
jgi:hypothetical protein